MSFAEVPQQKIQNYLRAFASWHGINTNDDNSDIHYNTRVESVQKRYAEDGSRTGWTLTVKELVKTSPNITRARWTTQVWAFMYQVGFITEQYLRISMRSLSLQANITRLMYQTLKVSRNGRNGSLIKLLTPASIVGQSLLPIKRSSLLVLELV